MVIVSSVARIPGYNHIHTYIHGDKSMWAADVVITTVISLVTSSYGE